MSKRNRPPKRSPKRASRTARDRISSSRPPEGKRRPRPTSSGKPGSDTFWIYGVHAVKAALENTDRRKHRLVATPKTLESHEFLSTSDIPAETLDRTELDRICGEDAVHQGVALLVSSLPDLLIEDVIEKVAAMDKSTIIVLDQASDPRNIGAVMRSARAFKADALVLQDRNSPPETGAMAKAASGAMETVPLVRVTNLVRVLWALKDVGYWVTGLDGYAETSLDDASPSEKQVIVLGAEGTGLRRLTRETCDQTVKIPIDEDAESLNLSNAAAVALYALTRAQRAGNPET